MALYISNNDNSSIENVLIDIQDSYKSCDDEQHCKKCISSFYANVYCTRKGIFAQIYNEDYADASTTILLTVWQFAVGIILYATLPATAKLIGTGVSVTSIALAVYNVVHTHLYYPSRPLE